MEKLLNNISVDSSTTEALEDNYVFTEEDLKIMPQEDLEDVFNSVDVAKISKWQKTGEFSETASEKKSKIKKENKTHKKKTKSSKKAVDVPERHETTPPPEDIAEELPTEEHNKSRSKKKSKQVKEEETSLKKEEPHKSRENASKHKKSKKKRKSEKTNNSESRKTKVLKNSKNVEIVEKEAKSEKIYKELTKQEQFKLFEDYMQSRTERKGEFSVPTTDHMGIVRILVLEETKGDSDDAFSVTEDAAFVIEEIFENQVLCENEWIASTKKDPLPFSDKEMTQEIKLSLYNDISELNSNGSLWKWCSEWKENWNEKGGWTYSKTQTPGDFINQQTKNHIYRRRPLRRSRINFSYENSKMVEYEKVREILIQGLIALSKNMSQKTTFGRFETQQNQIFEASQLLAFKKDVFNMFSNAQKSNDPNKEAISIADMLSDFFDSVSDEDADFKDTLANLEEMADKIAIFKTSFPLNRDLCVLISKFLYEFIDKHSAENTMHFFESLKTLFSVNKRKGVSKIELQPLQTISDLIFGVFYSCKDEQQLKQNFSLKTDVDYLKEKLKEALTDFHDLDIPILASEIGEASKSLFMLGEISRKMSNQPISEITSFLRSNATKSIMSIYNRKRKQFPDEFSEFINEDWEEYNEELTKLIRTETDVYGPKLFVPGINEHPLDQTVLKVISEYNYEANSFYSLKGPNSFTEKLVNLSLVKYNDVKVYLKSQEAQKYISDKKRDQLLLQFISYKDVFERKAELLISDSFNQFERIVPRIKSEKKDVRDDFSKRGKASELLKLESRLSEFLSSFFDSLEIYILDESVILKLLDALIREITKLVTVVVGLFYKEKSEKSNYAINFLNEDLEELELDREKSIAMYTTILRSLEVSDKMFKTECDKVEEADSKWNVFGVKTQRLCIDYNNVFSFLEKVTELQALMEERVLALRKSGKIKKFKFDLELDKHLKSADSLMEKLVFRLVLFDAQYFFHRIDNPPDEEEHSDKDIIMIIAKLGTVMSKKNTFIVIEAFALMSFKLIEWVLLDSDRTFSGSKPKIIRERVQKLLFSMSFFLPKNLSSVIESNSDTLLNLIKLMQLDDSDLLNAFRKVRDKGYAEKEFLPKKSKATSSKTVLDEGKNETLSSFFMSADFEDDELQEKIESSDGVKLSKEERNAFQDRVLSVIARRTSDVCRKVAVENGKKVPTEIDESDSEEEHDGDDEGDERDESSDKKADVSGSERKEESDNSGYSDYSE